MGIQAKLVRGNVYYYGNKRFDANVPVPVTEDERDYLEGIVDRLAVEEGEPIEAKKFEFTYTQDGAPAPAVAPSASGAGAVQPVAPAPARARRARGTPTG